MRKARPAGLNSGLITLFASQCPETTRARLTVNLYTRAGALTSRRICGIVLVNALTFRIIRLTVQVEEANPVRASPLMV